MSTVMTAVEQIEKLGVRDVISDRDLSRQDLNLVFEVAQEAKASPRNFAQALAGKQLAMIFEKPSLRTRVAFEVGMTSMGGHAIYLDHSKSRLGERESILDIAKNLERWVDGIVARTFSHSAVVELAEHASIPVVNGLTDLWHPCQAMADYFTLGEKFGKLKGLKFAFIGDGYNMCNSLMVTGAKLGVTVSVATPPGFEPKPDVVDEAKACAKKTGARIHISHDVMDAAAGANVIYTDVWTSMGQEFAAHMRSQIFAPYQVSDAVMAAADSSAVFMHCLPAVRGQEVVASVIDSPRSVVYDQAENRLHVQKALLLLLLQDAKR